MWLDRLVLVPLLVVVILLTLPVDLLAVAAFLIGLGILYVAICAFLKVTEVLYRRRSAK